MNDKQLKESQTLIEVFSRFNASPFLFIGSGFSRRYLGIPTWKELLEHFANQSVPESVIKPYRYYEIISKDSSNLPAIATLISDDYNDRWLKNQCGDHDNPWILEQVDTKEATPFKAEVANYIKKFTLNPYYSEEQRAFSQLCKKSLAGIVTTNYDCLLESLSEYQCFVGQAEMITANILGIGEIYKIHGSVDKAASLVITDKDYQEFEDKTAYLSAKLITIFMENPIVFIGYSIQDRNILNILEAIAKCYKPNEQKGLEERLYFVEYNPKIDSAIIDSCTLSLQSRTIVLNRIQLNQFYNLYSSMMNIETKIPVKILRTLKTQVVNFLVTAKSTDTVYVLSDFEAAPDNTLCLYIGTQKDFATKGYTGITNNQWYTDIVLDNLNAIPDELINVVYPILVKSNKGLPVYKYLSKSTQKTVELFDFASHKRDRLDDFISSSIKKNRYISTIRNRSIKGIISDFPDNVITQCEKISYLKEEEIEIKDLEDFLLNILHSNPDFLDSCKSTDASSLRRIIRIYDFLKFSPCVKKEG